LKSLTWLASDNDWWIAILLLPLFLIPLLHAWGFIIAIGICLSAGAVIYGIQHAEVLLILTLYAPIIKASPLNPVPDAIDLTVLFYALFLLVIAVLFIFKKWKFPRLELPDYLLILYLALVCLDYFHSPNEVREYATFKLVRFSVLSLPFYFFPKIMSGKALRHAGWLITFAGALVCLGLFLVFPTAIQIKGYGNSYLTMATLAGVTLMFATVMYIQEKRFLPKLACMTAVLIALLLVFKTNSRAGILFSSLVVLLYLGYVFRHKHLLALFTLIIFVFATTVTYQFYPDFFTRFFLIFKTHKGSSINLRFTLYQVSRRILAEQWFSGIGLGGFAKYHYLNNPHNFILESFLEHGIAGGLIMLTWVGSLIRRWVSFLRKGGLNQPYAAYFLSSVYLFLFFMTSFALESMRVLFFFAGAMMVLGGPEVTVLSEVTGETETSISDASL